MLHHNEAQAQHYQRMQAQQNKMMQEVWQLQSDQHGYAYWHDRSMSELTEEMQALTYQLDDLLDFVNHVRQQGYGVELFQGRDDAGG